MTATGREADDLTTELQEIFGDGVAQFPSWETLPHERLSPSADTVGRRLQVLRRLACPDEADYGPPLRVIVTTVRSLVQPMAPGLGDIEPVVLRIGSEHDFGELVSRLAELAYTRVDMVGKRGEFAVRGGILDVFRPRRIIRCASSSGATRSPNCGRSRSRTSVRCRNSSSARWSRRRAVNCC